MRSKAQRSRPLSSPKVDRFTSNQDQNDQRPILHMRLNTLFSSAEKLHFLWCIVCNCPRGPHIAAAAWPCTYLSCSRYCELSTLQYQPCFKLQQHTITHKRRTCCTLLSELHTMRTRMLAITKTDHASAGAVILGKGYAFGLNIEMRLRSKGLPTIIYTEG